MRQGFPEEVSEMHCGIVVVCLTSSYKEDQFHRLLSISVRSLVTFSKHDSTNEGMSVKIQQLNKMQNISSMLFNSNHCINFFFYFLFYSMFRDSIYDIFPKILRLKKKQTSELNLV